MLDGISGNSTQQTMRERSEGASIGRERKFVGAEFALKGSILGQGKPLLISLSALIPPLYIFGLFLS